jgi:hypothetical protein
MDRHRRSKMVALLGMAAATLAFSASVPARLANADDARRGHREDEWRGHVQRWRHGDPRSFHEHDLGRWRGGHWLRGEHLGRLGWWWVVDGVWYAYPAVVYPYPDPYVPPTVVVQSPPPPAPASAPAQPQYWYYCESQRAYYPYVAQCPEGWMKVVPQTAPR